MTSILPFLIPFAMLAVVIVLGVGLFAMFRGGTFNKKYGNKLMQMRVMLQAIAVGLVLLFVFLSGGKH